MAVSIRDVARSAGVSHGTVSKVLNLQAGTYISDTTRARVLAVAKEMGYRPHRIARALATGRTNLIALWMTHLDRPFFGPVIHEVQEQARRNGYGMIVGKMDYESKDSVQPVPLLDWPVDGILALDGDRWLDTMLAGGTEGLPVVSMGTYHATATDYVGVNLTDGLGDAVVHVHEQGARSIAWLSGGVNAGDARTVAYSDGVRRLGLSPLFIDSDSNDRSGGYRGMAAYLQSPRESPDAVIGYNDDLVIGAYRALKEAGLDSPRDVLLVGIDGTEEGEFHHPSISTVKQPIEEMCRLGWDFLQARIKDPSLTPQRVELKAELIVRESSVRA